jgi:hypothetical protein
MAMVLFIAYGFTAMHIEDTQRLVTERLKCSELYCSWWQVQAGKNRRSLSLFEAMLY